ncbi:MAG: WecB/TagA/CpsF family glycosyltransferase [Planctomycetota bacterium]
MLPNLAPPDVEGTFSTGVGSAVPVGPAPVINVPPVSTPSTRDEPAAPTPLPELPRRCVTIWDVPFDRVNIDQALHRIEELVDRRVPSYAITANLNYCMLHESDASVRRITADADLIVADGQPIVWRSQLTQNPLPERVTGSDMLGHLCRMAAYRGWRIYLLGGARDVPERAAEALRKTYPRLKIVGTESPPFRDLSEQEKASQRERIRSARPDILLVAFGQPKGDHWIYENHDELGVPFSMQVGASFDFMAGNVHRAPLWMQVTGLEWFHRMIHEPRRLVPRYAANAVFLGQALVRDWRRLVTHWGLGNWTANERRR